MTQKLKITLEPRSISACQSLPPELQFMAGALQHQIDVWNLAKTNDIILDLALQVGKILQAHGDDILFL